MFNLLLKLVIIRIKIGFCTLVTKKEGGSKAITNMLIFKELKLSCVVKAASC
jgi:hypothetical protein